MSRLTGAEIVIECLKEQGVDTVFGYPGGSILNIYDALYKHQDEITHILTSHEQGASHAADGYARATGRVGVCLATSGPGAKNRSSKNKNSNNNNNNSNNNNNNSNNNDIKFPNNILEAKYSAFLSSIVFSGSIRWSNDTVSNKR